MGLTTSFLVGLLYPGSPTPIHPSHYCLGIFLKHNYNHVISPLKYSPGSPLHPVWSMASYELHGTGELLSSVSCSILVPHRSRSYYQWPHGLCPAPSYPSTECHSPIRCGSLTTSCLFSPTSSQIQFHPDIKIMLLRVNDLPIANPYGTSQLICYFWLLNSSMPLSLAAITIADCFPAVAPPQKVRLASLLHLSRMLAVFSVLFLTTLPQRINTLTGTVATLVGHVFPNPGLQVNSGLFLLIVYGALPRWSHMHPKFTSAHIELIMFPSPAPSEKSLLQGIAVSSRIWVPPPSLLCLWVIKACLLFFYVPKLIPFLLLASPSIWCQGLSLGLPQHLALPVF